MTAAARPRAHGSTGKVLHWLTAGLVAAQITLALRAWKLPPGSVKNALLGEHMSFGLCVLLLHVAAALLHGLRRDGVLTRMLPFGGGAGA